MSIQVTKHFQTTVVNPLKNPDKLRKCGAVAVPIGPMTEQPIDAQITWYIGIWKQ